MVICIVWYLTGVIGCTIGTLGSWESGDDVTVGNILWCVVLSFFGLGIFVIGLSHYMKQKKVFSKVVFKGKLK